MKKLILIGTATLFLASSFAYAGQCASTNAQHAQSNNMQLAWNDDHHHKGACKEEYSDCMDKHHDKKMCKGQLHECKEHHNHNHNHSHNHNHDAKGKMGTPSEPSQTGGESGI